MCGISVDARPLNNDFQANQQTRARELHLYLRVYKYMITFCELFHHHSGVRTSNIWLVFSIVYIIL